MTKQNNDISISVLSWNKNFESLKTLLVGLNFCFKRIYKMIFMICTPTIDINFQTIQVFIKSRKIFKKAALS